MARKMHTPTPWTRDRGYISGLRGEPIAVLGPASMFAGSIVEREANGDLIVAAVNERAALREALQALLAGYDHTLPDAWRRDRPVSLARAVLALGEETKP